MESVAPPTGVSVTNFPKSVRSASHEPVEKCRRGRSNDIPKSGQTTAPGSEWLTTNEAAQYLKVKARTLLLWARQGKLKGYTLSGVKRHVWRFRKIDLDATLEVPSVRPEERMVQ